MYLFNFVLKVKCSSLYPERHCFTVTGYVTQVGRHNEEATDWYLGGTGFESQFGQRHLLRICKASVFQRKFWNRGASAPLYIISNSLFATIESFEHRETDNYSVQYGSTSLL
jgi:hypothetical protein